MSDALEIIMARDKMMEVSPRAALVFLFSFRIKVYQSNVVRHDLHPLWNQASLDIEAICNGDLDRSIKIIIWDHRRSGKHKHMGEFETTVAGLLNAKELEDSGEVVSFQVHKHEKSVGSCEVVKASIIGGTVNQKQEKSKGPTSPSGGKQQPRPSEIPAADKPEFIDYLTGGCQISLAVAIDFTASNGDPRQEGTPHYFHPPASKEWNDYEKAIFAVGSILAKYDSDQRFPVWGFGAKYNNVVRHCFQCGTDVEVEGVQGIMDAYRGVFRTPLTMSYPTKFTEVISTAASYARHEQVRKRISTKTFALTLAERSPLSNTLLVAYQIMANDFPSPLFRRSHMMKASCRIQFF